MDSSGICASWESSLFEATHHGHWAGRRRRHLVSSMSGERAKSRILTPAPTGAITRPRKWGPVPELSKRLTLLRVGLQAFECAGVYFKRKFMIGYRLALRELNVAALRSMECAWRSSGACLSVAQGGLHRSRSVCLHQLEYYNGYQ